MSRDDNQLLRDIERMDNRVRERNKVIRSQSAEELIQMTLLNPIKINTELDANLPYNGDTIDF